MIVVTEVITDIPSDFISEFNLTDRHKRILVDQINRFNLFREKEINNTGIITNEEGKLVLPEGTIIHGTDNFNPQKLADIAKTGVLTGQAVGVYEDCETFYCADFHRVSKDMTMEAYDKQFPYRDGRAPFNGRGKNSLALIVHPSQELAELLSYDCYREGTKESQMTKAFINYMPIEDHSLAASVLYGVPSNAFSGIVLGDGLFEKKEVLEYVTKLFPSCYVTSRKGDIIYEPFKEKTTNDELTEARRKNYSLNVKNDTMVKEMDTKDGSIAKEKAKYDSLMSAMLKVCSIEEAATIIFATGYQGSQEAAIKYAERLKASFAEKEAVQSNTQSL